MNKERLSRLKNYQKFEQLNDQGKATMKKASQKKTFPVMIKFNYDHSLAVFALVSGEVQLHQLKKHGSKSKFIQLESVQLDNIVQCCTVENHKVNGNLLLIFGTSIMLENAVTQTEIVIFELMPKQNYQVNYDKCIKFIWPHPDATNMIYNPIFGLLVTSFDGSIEIFNDIQLNLSVWNNQDPPIPRANAGAEKGKRIGGFKEIGSIICLDYSEQLDTFAIGGTSGTIHFMHQSSKEYMGNIEGHSSEIKLIKFYDKLNQLYSVTETGEIGIWD